MLTIFKVLAFLALILQGGAQNVTEPEPGPTALLRTSCGIDRFPTTTATKIVDLKDAMIVKHPYLFSAKFSSNGRELHDNETFDIDEMNIIDIDVCQRGTVN